MQTKHTVSQQNIVPLQVIQDKPIMRRRTVSLCNRCLGLGQEPLDWQQLVTSNVNLVVLFKRRREHTLLHLDGKVDFVDGPQDLVHFSNLGLVLQVNGRVKVGDFGRHQG